MPKFCQFKTIFELYLMGYYFCVNKKISKMRSLEHFGSSEHKVLPRNKSLIEILHISVKIPAVVEKQILRNNHVTKSIC